MTSEFKSPTLQSFKHYCTQFGLVVTNLDEYLKNIHPCRNCNKIIKLQQQAVPKNTELNVWVSNISESYGAILDCLYLNNSNTCPTEINLTENYSKTMQNIHSKK